MKIESKKNYIICGDNLEWLKSVPDGSVDLCYIDPPFFSNRNYEVIWGNGFELRSFGDRFAGGISHYIEWMRPRIELIQLKLKKTGCLFLHCDWHASHELRCVLDEVFGENNFRNEIIWQRTPFSGSSKAMAKKLPAIHDTILYYSKSKDHDDKFECPSVGYSEKYLKRFKHKDSRGYYRKTLLKTYSKETLKRLREEDRLIEPTKAGGSYNYKQYLEESNGKVQIGDIWTDINMLNPMSSERLGYPTQKPEALIKRILEMGSKKNDVVLDCFGGGGTTAKVATDMGRYFITGDVSPVSIKIMAERLYFDCPKVDFEIKNLPRTEGDLKDLNGHKFAEIVCEVMGWQVNEKKSGDGGIDGWTSDGTPIQVKNHARTSAGRPDLQKFFGALAKEKKKTGVFVAWKFAIKAREYIADMKREYKVEITALDCSSVFGGLLLDSSKGKEIEKLYLERRPKNWASKLAKSNSVKNTLDKAKDLKKKVPRRKLKDEEAS